MDGCVFIGNLGLDASGRFKIKRHGFCVYFDIFAQGGQGSSLIFKTAHSSFQVVLCDSHIGRENTIEVNESLEYKAISALFSPKTSSTAKDGSTVVVFVVDVFARCEVNGRTK